MYHLQTSYIVMSEYLGINWIFTITCWHETKNGNHYSFVSSLYPVRSFVPCKIETDHSFLFCFISLMYTLALDVFIVFITEFSMFIQHGPGIRRTSGTRVFYYVCPLHFTISYHCFVKTFATDDLWEVLPLFSVYILNFKQMLLYFIPLRGLV